MPGSASSLGAGSGRPNIPSTIGDRTIAGLATRISVASPTDADWGAEPPPNGTLVLESNSEAGGLLWVRLNDTWVVMAGT